MTADEFADKMLELSEIEPVKWIINIMTVTAFVVLIVSLITLLGIGIFSIVGVIL